MDNVSALKVFLNSSQANDDEMLKGLLEFLNERNLYNGDLNSLKIEIAKLKKRLSYKILKGDCRKKMNKFS